MFYLNCPNKEKGSTLVEVVLVVLVVGFLALLITNIPSSMASINKSRHSSQAKDIANRQIDNLRKTGYEGLNLTEEAVAFSDTDLINLPSANATYKVESCPETVCLSSENAKKVTVRIDWDEVGDEKSVELVTIVSEGGIGQ